MKPSYFFRFALPLAIIGGSAFAQSPPAKAPADSKPMVLLLDNFQIVAGTVERVGDGYRLRRGKDVTTYTAKQVLFAGESREEVYRLMMARGLKAPNAPAPATDYNSLAFRAFPSKVQPVLMNLCADCHTKPDHASAFKLTRVAPGYANQESSLRNAKEVARFLNREDPAASPILTQAVTAHGGQRVPALFNRTHPAYHNLELWAHWAAGPEGTPMPQTIPTRKPARTLATQPPPATTPGPEAIPSTPHPDDPYDPSVFNRATHPSK